MMEAASADKPDLIPTVDGEPVKQVVMSTQTSDATEGSDAMQQREHSMQKSHSCQASSTDGEQFDQDNTDCLQVTLSLNTLLSYHCQGER